MSRIKLRTTISQVSQASIHPSLQANDSDRYVFTAGKLISEGHLTEEEWRQYQVAVSQEVEEDYLRAEAAADNHAVAVTRAAVTR